MPCCSGSVNLAADGMLGMALYRLGFFQWRVRAAVKCLLWGWVGVICGGFAPSRHRFWRCRLTGSAIMARSRPLSAWSPVAAAVDGPGHGGAAGGLCPHRHRLAGRSGAPAAGRAAFTNYLGTSVVMMFVFHGWALGLSRRTEPPRSFISSWR